PLRPAARDHARARPGTGTHARRSQRPPLSAVPPGRRALYAGDAQGARGRLRPPARADGRGRAGAARGRTRTGARGRGARGTARPLLEHEPEEDPFSPVEREAGEGEPPADFLEAELPMERDRGRVASVGKEPGLGCALADPVETHPCQAGADALTALFRDDEDAREVVAARSRIRRSIGALLEQAGPAVADDSALGLGDDEQMHGTLEVAAQRLPPLAVATFRRGETGELNAA